MLTKSRLPAAVLSAALLFGAAAHAQGLFGTSVPPPPVSADQVRTRILDACVYDLARTADPLKTQVNVICGCYASGVIKLMNDEEVAAYARRAAIPGRIKGQAEEIYGRCRA